MVKKMATPENSSSPGPVQRQSAKIQRGDEYYAPEEGLMRFSPITLQRTNKGTRVTIHWKRALVSLVVAAVLGWVGLACGAYAFVKYRRGFEEVQFTHMLLYPWRQDEYRVARGEFLIAQSKKQLEKQELREAFYNLRVGLQLSPRNRDGRMLLAQFHVVWQRPDIAQGLLIDGVEYHSADQDYLEALFSFLLQRQADSEVIDISRVLLDKVGENDFRSERVQLIAMARATALFFRGNYDLAEDALVRYKLIESVDGKILALRVDWERGERDVALDRLRELTDELPENEQVYSQYAAYLRETGKDDELRRLCLLRQLTYPDRARPRIDLLYLYDKGKDETNVTAGIEAIFGEFSQNGDALLALADFAANTGRPELARRVYDHCKAQNSNWEGPALMTVEAFVVSGRYHEALESCRFMMKENPEWGKRFYSVFNGLQAIANFGLKDTEAAQLFLNNFLNQAGVRADNLVAVSNRLMTVGARDQARQVLLQAVKSDPLNQTALTGLIQLDLELDQMDSIGANLRLLMTMRKPPRELMQSAYDRLASDRYVFTPGRAGLLDELRSSIDRAPRA